MPKLNVYLKQTLAGKLNIDAHGNMAFSYDKHYLENKKNSPLSRSLPLQTTPFAEKQCRPFFSGLLPEAHLRASIARQLGISENNDFALLHAIGGECAGAVSILPETVPLTQLNPEYKLIKKQAVGEILQTMRQRPMIAGEEGIRLSLAGAQDKLPVAIIAGDIAIPLNGAPSTHILKPINRDFPSLIKNECFCLYLARKIGLNAVEASIHYAGATPYLLVKRYDRIETKEGIQRLHQEDFCQAMGIIPERKYQREGGPAIRDCFQLVRQASSFPVLDIKELLKGILFNLIIGNNDAHGKNFSLIYQGQQTRLAPFYDMISTVYYPELTTKMAMKIGSKYDFNVLSLRHIEQMAREADISVALTGKMALEITNKILDEIPASEFSPLMIARAHKMMLRLQMAK
ncbi:type II toxin-antitoxin system HipA family toxin [Legionella septentrionalis]|uniref:type II toxin-antitoxin system HipA family toxin n=1 Tax=Legionella septentrionalis TaxID=2498109 RepID=UPI000F8CE5F2|nr:type II toxin-antitoxin system HipA family toxin [Legionella septentrionalis]RUR10894.1 type II toxin-antitoxin system HipA family toxin [Legionella septentrionalis]